MDLIIDAGHDRIIRLYTVIQIVKRPYRASMIAAIPRLFLGLVSLERVTTSHSTAESTASLRPVGQVPACCSIDYKNFHLSGTGSSAALQQRQPDPAWTGDHSAARDHPAACQHLAVVSLHELVAYKGHQAILGLRCHARI